MIQDFVQQRYGQIMMSIYLHRDTLYFSVSKIYFSLFSKSEFQSVYI